MRSRYLMKKQVVNDHPSIFSSWNDHGPKGHYMKLKLHFSELKQTNTEFWSGNSCRDHLRLLWSQRIHKLLWSQRRIHENSRIHKLTPKIVAGRETNVNQQVVHKPEDKEASEQL